MHTPTSVSAILLLNVNNIKNFNIWCDIQFQSFLNSQIDCDL